MEKLRLTILTLLALISLTACSTFSKSAVEPSSSSVEIQSSSTIADEDLEDYDETEEEYDYDEEEDSDKIDTDGFTAMDLQVSAVPGYELPEDMKLYVGNYSGSHLAYNGEVVSGGTVVELKVFEDGTYRKLIKNYSQTAEVAPNKGFFSQSYYGYFDQNNQFKSRRLSEEVAGETLYLVSLNFSQGVVVEQYGDAYLVEIPQLSLESRNYNFPLDQNGEFDEALYLFRLLHRSTVEKLDIPDYLPETYEHAANTVSSALSNLPDVLAMVGVDDLIDLKNDYIFKGDKFVSDSEL